MIKANPRTANQDSRKSRLSSSPPVASKAPPLLRTSHRLGLDLLSPLGGASTFDSPLMACESTTSGRVFHLSLLEAFWREDITLYVSARPAFYEKHIRFGVPTALWLHFYEPSHCIFTWTFYVKYYVHITSFVLCLWYTLCRHIRQVVLSLICTYSHLYIFWHIVIFSITHSRCVNPDFYLFFYWWCDIHCDLRIYSGH